MAIKYFSVDRIKKSSEHLQNHDSNWVIVPLVFAVNGVNSREEVNINKRNGTDTFLSKHFSGELMGLKPFPNGVNTLRPRYSDTYGTMKREGRADDYVSHQGTKLWANVYSSRGYREMRAMGIVSSSTPYQFKLEPRFVDTWKSKLSDKFRFEELLVWLYAFSGFDASIDSWGKLDSHFQVRYLGEGKAFEREYRQRFNVSNLPWNDADLVSERPSDGELQRELLPSSVAPGATPVQLDEKKLLDHVRAYIQSNGYTFSEELIKNYWVCIKTKPLVLLTGIAGIGKTAITRLFAESIGAGYRRIAVKADWRDDSDLLGYENPLLKPPRYTRTEFVDLMLEAQRKPEELFFVCLDEMNLARVEYYFAKFLSGLESEDRVIVLHSSDEIKDVPQSLAVPRNLIFVGTVNMDETTFAFSPQVLDRANTIEISDPKLGEVHENTAEVDPIHISVTQFDSYRRQDVLQDRSTVDSNALAELAKINGLIKVKNQRFGFRVRNETIAYLANSENIFSENPDDNTRIAFDIQIKQKILPKLSGSGRDLRDSLSDLKQYFEERKYERSLEKVNDMISRFDRDGFTSFYD